MHEIIFPVIATAAAIAAWAYPWRKHEKKKDHDHEAKD
jgi:hypothetical protein